MGMTSEQVQTERYITKPTYGTARAAYHIFNPENGHRSLCGRFGMLRVDPQSCDPIEDTVTWVKGQDCKACWRKQGIDVGDPS